MESRNYPFRGHAHRLFVFDKVPDVHSDSSALDGSAYKVALHLDAISSYYAKAWAYRLAVSVTCFPDTTWKKISAMTSVLTDLLDHIVMLTTQSETLGMSRSQALKGFYDRADPLESKIRFSLACILSSSGQTR